MERLDNAHYSVEKYHVCASSRSHPGIEPPNCRGVFCPTYPRIAPILPSLPMIALLAYIVVILPLFAHTHTGNPLWVFKIISTQIKL